MSKIRVIVADDMEIIAQTVTSALNKIENVEVISVAENGEIELEKIQEEKPDLVFTDNQMPKLNGTQVIEKVNLLNLEHRPEFVLVTGDTDPMLYRQAEELKIMKIIHKPIAEDKIKEAINEYIDLQNRVKDDIITNTPLKSKEEIKEKKPLFAKLFKKSLKESKNE